MLAASAAWDREFDLAIRASHAFQDVTGDVVRFTETLSGKWWDRPQVGQGTLRFLDRETLAAFLHGVGFAIDQQFGDWRRGPLTDTSEEVITIARRG